MSGDESHLDPCISALLSLRPAPEIIVAVPSDIARDFQTRYPPVRFIAMQSRNTSEWVARSLAAATGDTVALIKDNCVVAPDWHTRLEHAHAENAGAIGGTVENGIDAPLNWAAYLCDFLHYRNPLPAGESQRLCDANASWKRAALEAVKPVWNLEFHEQPVSAALRANGCALTLVSDVVVYQLRRNLNLSALLRERYIQGRSFGAWRGRRIGFVLLAPVLPGIVLARMCVTALRKHGAAAIFLKHLPLIALLTLVWCFGETTGYLTGRPAASASA